MKLIISRLEEYNQDLIDFEALITVRGLELHAQVGRKVEGGILYARKADGTDTSHQITRYNIPSPLSASDPRLYISYPNHVTVEQESYLIQDLPDTLQIIFK